jgi:Spy/CpxP family protein refolding chaperone
MKVLFSLLFAAALLAAGPAAAQQKGRGAQSPKQGMQTQKTGGEREMHRERLSREQRDQLRRDINDANRDMKGRK